MIKLEYKESFLDEGKFDTSLDNDKNMCITMSVYAKDNDIDKSISFMKTKVLSNLSKKIFDRGYYNSHMKEISLSEWIKIKSISDLLSFVKDNGYNYIICSGKLYNNLLEYYDLRNVNKIYIENFISCVGEAEGIKVYFNPHQTYIDGHIICGKNYKFNYDIEEIISEKELEWKIKYNYDCSECGIMSTGSIEY